MDKENDTRWFYIGALGQPPDPILSMPMPGGTIQLKDAPRGSYLVPSLGPEPLSPTKCENLPFFEKTLDKAFETLYSIDND